MKAWRIIKLKYVWNGLLEKHIGMMCQTLIPPSSQRLEITRHATGDLRKSWGCVAMCSHV